MIVIRTAAASRGIAWFIEGFAQFGKSAAVWLGIVLILFIGMCASVFLPMAGLIVQVVTPVLLGGLMLGCRDAAGGGQLQLEHLFAGFRQNTGELVLLGVFYTIGTLIIMGVMAVLIIVIAGMTMLTAVINSDPALLAEHLLALLIVLLVGMLLYLPLLMAFWFAPTLVMLEGQSAISAMKYSFTGCLKNMPAFLLYGIAGLVLAVVATIPLMLGWVILIPVTIAGLFIAYRDIYVTVDEAGGSSTGMVNVT